jgi:hypothetical protein
MSGYSGGGIIPPAGDIGGTVLDPIVRDIGAVAVSLLGGATGDVLTQQAGGNFLPAPAGGGGGGGPLAFANIKGGPEGLTPFLGGNFYPLAAMVGPQLNGAGVFPIPCYPATLPSFEVGAEGPVFGAAWFSTFVGPGASVNLLPILETPPFTGGLGYLEFQFYYWAVSTDGTNNLALYSVLPNPGIQVGSFTSHQITTAELNPQLSNGADLSLVNGAGLTGNGLVSAAGGIP